MQFLRGRFRGFQVLKDPAVVEDGLPQALAADGGAEQIGPVGCDPPAEDLVREYIVDQDRHAGLQQFAEFG